MITYRTATAVNAKLGGHGDGTAEPQKSVDTIKRNHDHGVTLECFLDCSRNEVEERQHRKDGEKHIVVDDGRVTGEAGRDHVANKRHDEQRPEELQSSHGEVDNRRGTHCEGVDCR